MSYVIESTPGGRGRRAEASSETAATIGQMVRPEVPTSTDDSATGLALMGIFTIAVLVVTGAVALLALYTSWWVLGLVFGLYVLVTIAVVAAIFAALNDQRADEGAHQLGLEKVVFEAAHPEVFGWYVKNYGPEVNRFLDHSPVVQLECPRRGIWGTKSHGGRVVTRPKS